MNRRFHLSGLDGFVLLFTLSAVPSLWVGYDWRLGVPTLLCLAVGAIVYFAVSRLVVTEKAWNVIAGGLVVSGCLVGIYFITQAGRLEYAEKVNFVVKLSQWLSSIFPPLAFWRPQTNSIGTYMEGLLFLCIPLSAARAPLRWKWLWRAAFAILCLALLFSSSRGAWLAVLAVSCGWLAIYWRPMRWLLAVGVAAAVVFGGYALSRGLPEAVDSFAPASIIYHAVFNRPDRTAVIWNSLLLARDYSFTGIGLGGQFGLVYSRYQLYLPHEFLTYAHNWFLAVWLQQGVLGLVAWTGLVASALVKLKSPLGFKLRLQQEAAWMGLAALLLHGIVDARMVEDLWCWLPFFVLCGLLACGKTTERLAPIGKVAKWAPLALSALVLLPFLVLHPAAAAATNRGALYQMHADLSPHLAPSQREEYLRRAAYLFQSALEREPFQRGANYRLGLLALEKRDFTQAIDYFETASRSGAGHTGLDKTLGLAYTFVGNIDRGQPYLQYQIDIVNELNYWGWYFGTIDLEAASLNAYRQSLRIKPEQPSIRRLLDGS